MATKSPGIYFTETDNTQYENPKSVSGTTLAVVGYASKGPIGVPTEINSWREFVSTFGKPLDGYYSGLTVKNFLSAGGSVLFLRIADTTASPSNYVVKNPIAAKNGYITFTRKSDIMPIQLKSKKLYSFKLGENSSTIVSNPKYFFIKPPVQGKRLTQASVVNQIANQIGETPATFEGALVAPSMIKDGFYGFNISLDNKKIDEETDFYIETFKEQTKESLSESLKNSIRNTSATVEINLDKSKDQDEPDTPGLIGKGDNLHDILLGRKVFYIVKSGKDQREEVEFSGDTITLKDAANVLDKKLNDSYGIRVLCVYGKESQRSRLVFVSKNKISGETFEIKGLTSEDPEYANSLFVAQKVFGSEDKVDTGGQFEYRNEESSNHLYVSASGYKSNPSAKNTKYENETEMTASYDPISENFVITTRYLGKEKSISIVDGKFAEYDDDKSLSLFGNVFTNSFSIKGQDSIDITVKNDNGKVKFEGMSITPPALSPIGNDEFIGGEGQENFLEFLDLEKDEELRPSGPGYDDPVEGNTSVPASARDKVIFTSRELGSGTDNIEVETYTTVNPLDEKDIKHNLIVYVDGNRREAFENISLNPDDGEGYFVSVINKTVENGGSAYIMVSADKKVFDEDHKEIELPDGRYKLGKSNKLGDRAKSGDSLIIDYDNYEYAVGTNGIPDVEGEYLFAEAMKPGTSSLANKELYDFHIIQSPDDPSDIVQDARIKLCEDRGDAITIIDPPQGLDKKSVIAWHNGRGAGRSTPLDSNYAATYWPWCKVFDNSTGSGKFTWVMPSVIMAAQYVRVDRTAGCHMAPAGEVNGILPVIDIEQYPNKLDRDELYTDYNRVNPLTKFKDGSIIAYGEKTTQRKDSVLTKIHTRRMLVQIKKQCRAALRGYIFMPNTVDYLGKISNNITAILEGYKSNGGISFYKVICDETNNPTEVRQQDMINVDVVLVPEGTIEQININLTLNKSAETVED